MKEIELMKKYTLSGKEALFSMKEMIKDKKLEDKFGLPKNRWGFSYFQKMYTSYRDIAIKKGEDITSLPRRLKF